jgi:hypothetical protein
MSAKRFKSKLQRQAQTRPLDAISDGESLSQYSLSSTPSIQTPRQTNETEFYETESHGSPIQQPFQEIPHNLDNKSER